MPAPTTLGAWVLRSRAYQCAIRAEIAPDIIATFLGFDDLVALKTKAGRKQDITDLEALRAVQEDHRP